MHLSYNIILGLVALGTARPAFLSDKDVHIAVRVDSEAQWPEVLNQIQQAAEQACHNTCMKFFPDEGTNHDNCMKICRE